MKRPVIALSLLLTATGLPVPAAHAGGGCAGPMTDGRTTTVRIVHACFGPTIAHVAVGAKVRWENRSGMMHNLSAPDGWYVDELADGQGTSRTFTVAGIYPYACTIHVGMTGAVVVGNATGAPARGGAEPENGTFVLAGQQPAATAAEAETNASGKLAQPVVPAAKVAEPKTVQTADGGSDAVAWIAGLLLVLVAAALAIGRRGARTVRDGTVREQPVRPV